MPTPKSLFPAGHIISQHITSLKEMDFNAWSIDLIQLDRGAFYSYIDLFHTYNVQLGITHRSIRLAANGDVSPHAISFVMIIDNGSIIQQKQKMTNRHLAVMQNGGEIDAVFVEPISFISVAVNREIFYAKYEQKFHQTYYSKDKFELRICSSDIFNVTKQTLQIILKAHQANRAFYTIPENMIILEDNIIDHMLNLLHASYIENRELKWVEPAHDLFELIKVKYEQDISIESLCKELHISQRNGYFTFQKHYGITPKQYLLSMRLGKIKQALEVADPNSVKIEHIALKNGFYHMSHFAKIYKSFFGELPSQTLAKNK
ncbi:MAG: helix-turn-helix transcriptional regulator [Sulfuricurvum sp.]